MRTHSYEFSRKGMYGMHVVIFAGGTLRPGMASIEGQVDDLLSLLPLTSDAIGVSTRGLYYPLHGEILHFGKPRGVSNVLRQGHAEVFLEGGLLLIIHTDIQELS